MTETNKTIANEELAKEMFRAGVHWGHRKTNWHPKMEQYIFGVKNNIQIIDLEQTIKGLQNALEFIRKLLKMAEKFFS